MLTTLRDTLILATIIPLLPVLLPQGVYTRRVVPRLEEATGRNRGTIAGVGDPFKLVMLGESTVAGVGAGTYGQSLAAQTATSFNQHTGRTVQWHAIGQNGIRAAQVRTHLLPRLDYCPDLICIALGVNDVTHFTTRRRWQRDLRGLFQDIHLRLGSIPVMMCGLPPLYRLHVLPQPLRWYLGARAMIFDRLTRLICGNFYHVSYLALPDLIKPAYFSSDQFHPSALGYAAWGKYVAGCLCA